MPPLKVTAAVLVVGFGVGFAVGWATGELGSGLAAPPPQETPSPTPSPTPESSVSVPPLAPIDREVDDDDRTAGLVSLTVPRDGAGTFTTVTRDAEATGDTASVRLVRVEFEDGLAMSGPQLASFVLEALNDPRGWGARGRFEFVPTAGAPDLRVVIASPVTVAATCPDPHVPARVGAAETNGASPEPSPTADAGTDVVVTCADQGLVMVSLQDWAAGLESFGDDRSEARAYLINHYVGHALGEADATCESGRAPVMTDQRELAEECDPNAWPNPDEPITAATPEPTPEPTS